MKKKQPSQSKPDGFASSPKGQQRRPPPVADRGRSCWGSGQQDASEADAGSRNPLSQRICEGRRRKP
nr:MAG TPA: hypothetical protein [Caudoviricetes sp.]